MKCCPICYSICTCHNIDYSFLYFPLPPFLVASVIIFHSFSFCPSHVLLTILSYFTLSYPALYSFSFPSIPFYLSTLFSFLQPSPLSFPSNNHVSLNFISLLLLFQILIHYLLLHPFDYIRSLRRLWRINAMTQTPRHAVIRLLQLLPLSQLHHQQLQHRAMHHHPVHPRHLMVKQQQQ